MIVRQGLLVWCILSFRMVKEEPPRIERPRSVTILAFLQVLQSLGFLGFGVMQVLEFEWPEAVVWQTPETFIPTVIELMVSGIGLIFVGVLMLIVTIELLRLRSWAWILSMSVQGMGLFAALSGYLRGEPNYLSMALGVLLVFYLNQQEVQDAFRQVRGPV
jgi:hypothetical protein